MKTKQTNKSVTYCYHGQFIRDDVDISDCLYMLAKEKNENILTLWEFNVWSLNLPAELSTLLIYPAVSHKGIIKNMWKSQWGSWSRRGYSCPRWKQREHLALKSHITSKDSFFSTEFSSVSQKNSKIPRVTYSAIDIHSAVDSLIKDATSSAVKNRLWIFANITEVKTALT